MVTLMGQHLKTIPGRKSVTKERGWREEERDQNEREERVGRGGTRQAELGPQVQLKSKD